MIMLNTLIYIRIYTNIFSSGLLAMTLLGVVGDTYDEIVKTIGFSSG